MNKKGLVGILGLMIGIVVIIMAFSLAPLGKEVVEDTMNQTNGDTFGLDCNNSTISNFDKATCAVTNFSLFAFFGALIFIGGAYVMARVA